MEDQINYIPVSPEDFIEDSIIHPSTHENTNQVILLHHKDTQEDIGGDDKKARIISLDKIGNYSNLFIAVHPFIMHGYRIRHNFKECLLSLFKFHNETTNIWSHLLSFVLFIVLFVMIMIDHPNTKADNKAMIILYMIAAANCFICSSIYHTYNCYSNTIGMCVFKVDLFGIILQLGAATIAAQHFMFHDFEVTRKAYTGVYVSLCILIFIFMNIPIFMHEKLNVVRILLILSLFLISFMSCIHWACIAEIREVEELTIYLYMGWGFMFFGFFFYFSKFPECQFQSYYVDIYFQSHTLWHCCVTACAMSYYYFIHRYNEIINQKQPI
jgi:adiponectin receptor